MDTRFEAWNIRSLYRAGLLVTVSKEPSKWKLDLVGVQEVRWDKYVTELTFFYGKGNENHELGTGSLCIRKSNQQLRGLSMLMIRCHT
jgi:hypothetical protein